MSGDWSNAEKLVGVPFLVHNVVVIIELTVGFGCLSWLSFHLIKNFRNVNSIVKTFSALVVADWAMVIIFLPQAVDSLARGHVRKSISPCMQDRSYGLFGLTRLPP
jgi:hypothetical protein